MARLLFMNILTIILLSRLSYSIPFSINISNGTNATLKYIQILFRHGARSPLQVLPTDPIGIAYWNKLGGLGQLTPAGTKQEYDFGAFIKNYYNSFLTNYYDRTKVYIRSTDLERTLTSSYAFMAGMYQPDADQVWNPDLNWLPIPVHTTKSQDDPLFTYGIPCPMYDYLRNQTLNSSSYLNMVNENKDFIQNMSALSGLNLTLYDIWKLADVFVAEQAQNLSIPAWGQQNYDKIISLKDYTYTVDYGTVDKAIFFGGALINEVRNNLIKRTNGSSNLELSAYTNHDSYMGGVVSLLNFTWPIKQLPFAGAVIFELYQDNIKNATYYVQLLYKNNSIYEPTKLIPVQIKGCDLICPLDKFLQITSDKVLTDYETSCNLFTEPSQLNDGSSILYSAKSFVWKILILLAIIRKVTY